MLIRPFKTIEYDIYSLETYFAKTWYFDENVDPGITKSFILPAEVPYIKIVNFKIHCQSDYYDVLLKTQNDPSTNIEATLLYKDVDTFTLYDTDINAFILHNLLEDDPVPHNRFKQTNDRDLYMFFSNTGTLPSGNITIQMVYQRVSSKESSFKEILNP